MKCTICKYGNTQLGIITTILKQNDTTTVIQEVPADICDNCGEEYLSQAISTQLLKYAEEAVNTYTV